MGEVGANAILATEGRHGRFFRRVNAIWRSGQHSRAVTLLRALHRRQPNDPEVLEELAWTLLFSGWLEEGARAMLEYARNCRERGSLWKAVELTQLALRQDRAHRADGWAFHGQLFLELGDLDEAWKSLEAAYEASWKESEASP